MNDLHTTQSTDSFQATFFVNTPPSSNHDVTITSREKDTGSSKNDADGKAKQDANESQNKKGQKRKYTNAELNEIKDKEIRKKLRNRQSALAARERKKAKMLHLEGKVVELEESKKKVEEENEFLRARLQTIALQLERIGVKINRYDENPSDMFPIIDFSNLSKKSSKGSVESLSCPVSYANNHVTSQLPPHKNFSSIKSQVYLNENPFDFTPANTANIKRKELGPFLSDKPTNERGNNSSNFLFNCGIIKYNPFVIFFIEINCYIITIFHFHKHKLRS